MSTAADMFDRLERNVDLPSYLAQRGYEVFQSPQASASTEGITMRHQGTDDVVVVKKDPELGKWSYVDPRNREDHGNITEFFATRDGSKAVESANRLIALCDPLRREAEAQGYRDILRRAPPELERAKAEHLQAVTAEREAGRILERMGVQKGTLDEWRFGSAKDERAITKLMTEPAGLWASKYRPTDRQLVFTERPVDAIAYERSHGKQLSCYMATGSHLGDEVKRKIAHMLCEVPAGVTVVLAFGRDEPGRLLADQVRALAPALKMERQMPDFGARWSDQMQLEQRHIGSRGRRDVGLSR